MFLLKYLQLKICCFKVSRKTTIVIHKNHFKTCQNAGVFNKLLTFPTLATRVTVDFPSDSGGI